MVEVVVEHEYEAVHDDELTLQLGDVIRNVRRIDEDGWMEGELDGKRGLFPDNFVKEVKKEEPTSKEEQKEVKDVPPLQRRTSGNVASLVQRISTYGIPTGGLGFQPHSQPRASKKNLKKRQCRVVFEYVPQNEDELELKVGEMIDITEEVEEGWWSGTMDGKSGLFPSNFVKEIEPSEDAETSDVTDESELRHESLSPTSPLAGNGVMAQPKKVIGIGFGDIFREGSVKLHKVQRTPPENEEKKDKPIPSLPTKPAPPIAPDPPRGEKEPESKEKVKDLCRVTFTYAATNQDELDLKEGDIICLLSKDTGEPGWWRGELNGRQGVFPDNFVTLIPETDKETVTHKGSIKASPKQEAEEKPKKPPPPSKTPVLKPDSLSADKRQSQTRTDDKVIKPLPEKPTKPAAPLVPPKKPVPPNKGLLRPTSIHGKPLAPSPLAKQVQNGDVSLARPKSECDPIKPKTSLTGVSEKNSDAVNLMSFDDVSTTSEKLTHPTANRPKMPGRRPPGHKVQPPSKELKKSEKTEKLDAEEVTSQTPSPSPAPKVGSASPVQTSLTPESKPRADSEKKPSDLEELKDQMKELVLTVELLKTQQLREIQELRDELDEEKLKRVALQVEIEKLRKIVQST